MKRANIKLVTKLDKELNELSDEIEAWKKSDSFNGFDGKIQIKESGIAGKYFNINLSKIPFSDLKNAVLKSLNEKQRILEWDLQ